MANIVLDDWQQEFMDYKGHSLCCTGRRVGKTYIHARKACKRMLEKPNTRIIVASLTEDQAMLIIMFALDFLEKNYNSKIKKKQTYTNSRKITINNGSTMIARPVGNTGDAIRGFEGDVLILDEVSRFNELILEAATPVLLTTGGEIWACSTPFGKKGWFYRSFLNKDNRFKIFYISTEKAIKERPIRADWTEEKQKAALKFLEEEKKDKSELQYGQEYLGLFLDELRQFFPDELISKCCTLERQEIHPGVSYLFLGVDIARMGGDECAYQLIQSKHNKFYHILSQTKKFQPTTQTEQDIIDLNTLYRPEKIGIDAGAGSLGVGLYDRFMINPNLNRKVISMNNRTISLDRRGERTQRILKEDMYDLMLSMMENGELMLLKDDNVMLSLKSVQWELSKDKTKARIFGDYTHIAEGLVRACYLAKKEKSKNINILSI